MTMFCLWVICPGDVSCRFGCIWNRQRTINGCFIPLAVRTSIDQDFFVGFDQWFEFCRSIANQFWQVTKNSWSLSVLSFHTAKIGMRIWLVIQQLANETVFVIGGQIRCPP